ncbi:MAG TPA: thioredoxin family protein [Candidatus Angelobacter sp.]|jgi:thiol-disulfide isomerase/thioredoxin|nr:thioredoxin family protein [Candidatus Angelobacter sp.]
MLERATIILGIAIAVVTATVIVRAWSNRRLRRLQSEGPAPLWSALGERPDGRPLLVVFSTPGCTACRTTQRPAVESVATEFGGGLRVLSVDMADRPSIGRAFNVLTAPTTVVLDGDGNVQRINHGFAPAETLAAQISALGA